MTYVLQEFDKNIRFTYDSFDNSIPHFLDIEISPDGLNIFRKDTFTGQYNNFNSFTPWQYRISWIRSLVYRVYKICSANKINVELKKIKTFLLWNNFPKYLADRLIHKFKKTAKIKIQQQDQQQDQQLDQNQEPTAKIPTVWINLPYIGDKGMHLTKTLIRKLRRCITGDVRFRIRQKTTKIGHFTSTKDKTPLLSKSNVVYLFTCPSCGSSYVGKTDRTLRERLGEHSSKTESAIHDHLDSCEGLNYTLNLFNFSPSLFNDNFMSQSTTVNKAEFYSTIVNKNTRIIASDNQWDMLLFKEAYYIKNLQPILNNGLRASRELYLFK